jgi:hypothetical protein
MFKELFQAINDQAVKANGMQPVDVGDPEYLYFHGPQGVIEKIPRPPKPRQHKVETLNDLLAAAGRYQDGKPASVWFNVHEVVAITRDDDHPIDRVTFKLTMSDPWMELTLLESKSWCEHKDFVRLLRINLAGCGADALLESVRKMKFENGAVVTSEVARNRESLGRSITSQATGEKEIPEELTLSVPIYSNRGETDRYGIRCSVEVDPLRGLFRLLPMPDEIERVYGLALESIRSRLEDALPKDVPAFCGMP